MTTRPPHLAPRRPRLFRTLACAVALCCATSLAHAQEIGDVQFRGGAGPAGPAGASSNAGNAAASRPPRIGTVDASKTITHYLVGILVIGLCVGVVIIPGRRDHDE